LQKAANGGAKGGLSVAKRPPFTRQKAAGWKIKNQQVKIKQRPSGKAFVL
jgi:hypothetical protein